MTRALSTYRSKRDFSRTAEPPGTAAPRAGVEGAARFVVQKHDASHLHYDFRLEIGGVMKSWAVPKGPSLEPAVKRLAVQVEDHPVEYNTFEGTIPEGQYGGGTVMLWDRGELLPRGGDGTAVDLAAAHRKGRLDFTLRGERLKGAFTLTRMAGTDGGKPRWLLLKRTDEHARPGSDVTRDETTSVASGRAMAEIAGSPEPGADDQGVIDQLARLEHDAGHGTVTFDDATSLEVSHLDRAVFPAAGVTKGALMRYYARAAPALLRLLADRPLALRRFPRGVDGPSFFQQEPRDWPDAVRTAKVRLEDGTTRPRLVGGTLATLLYTVQMGAISAHPWLSRVGSLATPDHVVIDLDPAEGLPFDRVVAVAQGVREALAARGLTGSPKTSGASGLHVMIAPPRRLSWKAAAALAEGIANDVAAALPRLTTLVRSPAKRPAGTVYLDHLQNARGKTVASAWSVRATPGATVSTPLEWDEVTEGLEPRAFTMETALARLGDRVKTR